MNRKTLNQKIDIAKRILIRNDICLLPLSDISQLESRLDQKKITIAIFGQFKRGKSSLINSILQEEVLPVGIVPITSVVTKVQYGEKLAFAEFAKGEKMQLTIEQLQEYISEQNNPNNKKEVESVSLFYPSDFLKKGIILVDTPGVGSMHKSNTETAYSYVKESDAVVFLLSVDSPVNEIESAFLREIREYIAKVYFVVNKVDLISESELADYITYCQTVLKNLLDSDQVRILPISTKETSHAGVQQLVATILHDIGLEGEEILVMSVQKKLTDYMNNSLSLLNLQIRALSMPVEQFDEASRELSNKLIDLDEMSQEVLYLMNQKTDQLMSEIKAKLEEKQGEVQEFAEKTLSDLYKEHLKKKPKVLEKVLANYIETEINASLEEINQIGNQLLSSGFETIAHGYDEKLLVLHGFLNETIYALFHVEYPFVKDEYRLSTKTQFYVRSHLKETYFIPDIQGLVYWLPPSKANPIILDKYLKLANEDIARNITNMISDYHYKLRESKRSFNTQFTIRAKELSQTFVAFVQKTIEQRDKMEKGQLDWLRELQEQVEQLEQLLAE